MGQGISASRRDFCARKMKRTKRKQFLANIKLKLGAVTTGLREMRDIHPSPQFTMTAFNFN